MVTPCSGVVSVTSVQYVVEMTRGHSFVQWCDKNYLELNVCKTKVIVIDFRRNIIVPNLFVIKGVEFERVETYKYLWGSSLITAQAGKKVPKPL